MGAQDSKTEPGLCALLEQRRSGDCVLALDQGALANQVDKWGRSPLRVALELGDAVVYKALIDRDARLSPPLPDHLTPLHFAASHGHYDLAKLLLHGSAASNKAKNAKNAAGRTALHLAVLSGNAEMTALLLKYNCDSLLRDRDGLTARDLAVMSSAPLAQDIVEQLSAEDVLDKAHFESHTKTSPHAPPSLNPSLLPRREKDPSTHGSKSTDQDPLFEDSIPREVVTEPIDTLASTLDFSVRDTGIPLIHGSDLVFHELINRGSSCEVYRAEWRGGEVAVKQFRASYKDNPKELSKFVKEMQTLACVRHPNLILLMGICTDLPNLCLITEYVPYMSLFTALHSTSYVENKSYCLTIKDRFSIALQVARGLAYLHACEPPIIHRDLKPENCLLDHSLTVKIADFGLARPLTCFSGEEALTTTCIGTTRFMAPELFEKERAICLGPEVDIWALGCLLIELFSNKRPWDYISTAEVNCIYYEVLPT